MNISLSPEDYATAYHLLSETSRNTENVGAWFERHLLARLPARPSLLDVGAGPGAVARRLAPHFAALTLLEPNPNQLGAFDLPGARLHHTTLEGFDSSEQYDVVLCSHMLYHVPVAGWAGFVDRLLARVRPGGFCVFVLMAARGPNYELHRDFTPTVITTEPLKALLQEKALVHEVYRTENGFSSTLREEMETRWAYIGMLVREFQKVREQEQNWRRVSGSRRNAHASAA